MTSKEATKLLKGKKITKVNLHPFSDGRGGYAHDPVIYMEDGTLLRFTAEETDRGEYGVALSIVLPPEQGR